MSTYLKLIINKLTPESRSTLDSAINYAISREHHEVDCLHFLWKLLQEYKYITERFYELSLFNPERVLNAIESELIHINTAPQSSPVFSESMQTLLEKAWIHATTKWQYNHIDLSVFLITMINIRDSIFPYNVADALYCDVDAAEKLLISFSGKTEH
ncbi:type VI secretion system ATPase TssH, partial [Escherichia coli]|nr:type VI secretion system ATPase TssH [Escherichia coli]